MKIAFLLYFPCPMAIALLLSLTFIMKSLSIPFWQQKGIPKNCRKAKISGRCPIFPKPNASHFYSVKRSSVFYAKIGPRLSPKLFAMRDFLTACGLQSGIIGRHAPPKIVCRAGFLAECELRSGIIPRSPEDCLQCGILRGVWIVFRDYRPRKKITPKNIIFTTRAARKGLFHPRRRGGSHTE